MLRPQLNQTRLGATAAAPLVSYPMLAKSWEVVAFSRGAKQRQEAQFLGSAPCGLTEWQCLLIALHGGPAFDLAR